MIYIHKIKIHMQTKNLFGIFLLFFWAFSFMECSKDDKIEDEMEAIKMYISAETSTTYHPRGATQPVETPFPYKELIFKK